MMLSRRMILKIGTLAAPAIITGRSAAWIHGSTQAAPASLLTINLIPDPNGSVNNAPAGFTSAVQAAATMIQNACPNTAATINVLYGYDTILGGGSMGASASAADLNGGPIAYTTLRTAYISKASSTIMSSVASHLPNTSTLGGLSTLNVPSSQQKALGLMAPNSTHDSYIVIGAGVPSGNWAGVALHELSQALGRITGDAPFVFSCFTAAGTWFVTSTTGIASYFSSDGGTTKIADYDKTSDIADFLNGGVQDGANPDPFDANYAANTIQTLTTADIKNLNAMGFQ